MKDCLKSQVLQKGESPIFWNFEYIHWKACVCLVLLYTLEELKGSYRWLVVIAIMLELLYTLEVQKGGYCNTVRDAL